MASYIAISILKTSVIPKSYLPQKCLNDYLSYSKICNGKRNRSKLNLIGMIIEGKVKERVADRGTDLTLEEADKILKEINKPSVASKFNGPNN